LPPQRPGGSSRRPPTWGWPGEGKEKSWTDVHTCRPYKYIHPRPDYTWNPSRGRKEHEVNRSRCTPRQKNDASMYVTVPRYDGRHSEGNRFIIDSEL
jgi:hypothetical protein